MYKIISWLSCHESTRALDFLKLTQSFWQDYILVSSSSLFEHFNQVMHEAMNQQVPV